MCLAILVICMAYVKESSYLTLNIMKLLLVYSVAEPVYSAELLWYAVPVNRAPCLSDRDFVPLVNDIIHLC